MPLCPFDGAERAIVLNIEILSARSRACKMHSSDDLIGWTVFMRSSRALLVDRNRLWLDAWHAKARSCCWRNLNGEAHGPSR